MTKQEVTRLLRTLAANEAARAPGCPDEHELAAYVDGSMAGDARDTTQHHLAECDFCVRQVGLLSRLRRDESEKTVSEFLLARARRLGTSGNPSTPAKTYRWATAAALVLAIALLVNWSPDFLPGGDGAGHVAGDGASTLSEPLPLRNRKHLDDAPQLLAPVTGSSINPKLLQISWTETPGSLYYEVRIVNDEGKLVWRHKLEATTADVPESLGLKHGAEYFVRVDAYLESARTLSSHHVPFTVEE